MTTTSYELTPSQQLSMLNRHWTLHKAIVNIATSVVVTNRVLDAGLLAAAVALCVQRWDCFGIRFSRVDGGFRQSFGERSCLAIERRTFEDPAAMERFFLRRAARRIPMLDSPQASFVVFTTPDGHVGLYSVVSHLIMDSWAISRFYGDVIDVYFALASGEPLPTPPRDLEPILSRELAYHHSERSDGDRAFWEAEWSSSQPLFTSLKGPKPLERFRAITRNPEARECWVQHLRTKADHIVLRVDPDDVARLRAFVEQYRVGSMQALFVLALRTWLSRQNGRTPDVTFGVNVARRATLAQKNTGGSLVANLSLRTILAPEVTFLEALTAIVAKQDLLFRHADFSSIEMFELQHRVWAGAGSRPGMNYYDVLLTFQPVPMDLGHDLECRTDWHCNGAFSLSSYLTVMDDDGSGGLRCYWERQVHGMPEAVIRECQAYMLRVLRAGVENPSVTLGELMDLA